MNQTSNCPDSAQLLALLDCQLSSVDQSKITDHVETCDTCQGHLDTLVSDGLPSELHAAHLKQYLGTEYHVDDSITGEVINRLTATLFERTVTASSSLEEISLDFLEPSENPEHLGRLGQFEITEIIGRGGMGIALKGRDTRLDRVVAIKVLAPELASNPTARKRFLREAQAAAAVSHDHVVTTYAVEPGELPYLAMEFIDGQSLQQKLDREGPFEVREIFRIAMQTGYGLAAAHAQGLIHRDIKPSNILLQNGVERVQITDFGLARAVDDVALTRTGEVTGTPLYMSPEQAQGHALDQRSDLFSLGCVMYAMCTGRSPFRADSTMAVLNRVCNDTPRPISEINEEIPVWLIGIVEQLLEKDPQNRFQSAAEVADLLSQCLAHIQQPAIVPLPDSLPKIRRDRLRRSPRFKWYMGAILLVCTLMSLGVSEATGVTQFSSAVISIVRGDGTLVIDVNDPKVSVTIEGDDVVITGAGPQEVRLKPGNYQLSAQRNGEAIPLERKLVSITRNGREVVRVTLDTAPNVKLTVDYTSIPSEAITEFTRLRTNGIWVTSLEFSASGKQLLATRAFPAVEFWDIDKRTYDQFAPNDSVKDAAHGALSPDGRLAALAATKPGNSKSYAVQVWETDTGRMRHEFPAEAGFDKVDFSHDGRFLAAGRADSKAFIWDLRSDTLIYEFDTIGAVRMCEFSPIENTILFGGDEIALIHYETGRELWRIKPGGHSHCSAFSSDGKLFATALNTTLKSASIQLFETQTGKRVQRLVGHSSMIRSLDFLPDGRHLISGSEDRTLRTWDVDSGAEVARVETKNHVTHYIAVSPDGRRVATGGGAFAKLKDYQLRPHETTKPNSRTIRDYDHDIRIWQLPESVWPEPVNDIATESSP